MEKNVGLEYDLLTGLHSRWYARIALQEVLEKRAFRVFCSIDIDGFSAINERFGSETGDRLLQAIATVLRSTYKEELVFHFAGDEFCVLINPTSYSRYQMSMMTRTFFMNLHQIRVEGLDDDVQLSFSIGSVFVDPEYFHSIDEIYRQATFYRREAKKHEGNFLYSRYGCIPDVEGAFLSLREDRARYNNLSNRLFRIHNQEDWMEYVNEGAKLKERMFTRNQGHLSDIVRYFQDEGLPNEEYDVLFSLVINYSDALDAFMFVNIIDDILLPHYEQMDRSDVRIRSYLGNLYLLLADNLISVMRMGDKSQCTRIKQLLLKALDVCRDLPHDSIYFEPYYLALCEILGHYETLDLFLLSREECDCYYDELRKLSIGPDAVKLADDNASRYFNYLVQNAKLFPYFRSFLLKLKAGDRTPSESQELCDRQAYIRAHLVDGVYDLVADDTEYAPLASFMQDMILEEVSYEEMVRRLTLALNVVHKLEYGRLSESNLVIVAYFFLASSVALSRTSLPQEQTHETYRKGVNFLIELLRNRETLASDNQLLFMTQVMLNEMMDSSILSPVEKAYYLEQILVAVSLDAYSHCKIVGKYANVILSNIIEHKPELLVGPDRPYATQDDLLANRQHLLDFMDYASMMHDIGKIIIVPITSNSYRKLTDKEFALIRNHVEGGARILRHDPAFLPFVPFVRTHHRWWNGEGGYPMPDHSEPVSKLKVLVDILTICDTLEAATSHIGRNYRKAKTFLQILDELYADSGTRYSREILMSIIGSEDTYYTLHQMIDNKWQQYYQMIFQDVVTHSPLAFHDIQRSALPDIYASKASSADNREVVTTSQRQFPVPEWLLQLSEDDRLLFTCTLMEFNRLSVRLNPQVVFFYDVKRDSVNFLYRDQDNQVRHMIGQHYSEHRMDMFFSKEGYQKAMEILTRVVTDPAYPKEGNTVIESQDKSQNLIVTYKAMMDDQQHVLTVAGQVEDLNTTRANLLDTIHRQNRHSVMYESLAQMFEIALYTDITLEHVTLLKASAAVQHEMGQLTNTRDFIQYTRDMLVDPDSKPAFDAFIDVSTLPERLKGKPSISLEYRSRLSGWLLARIIPAKYDKKGNLTHVIFAAEIAEAEHEKHALLTHAASFDGLTGLLNRSKGEEIIRQKIAKGGAQIFAILDCDHFKRINDHLSHMVGDEVLREQSRIIKEVFAGFTTMRLGGDEFVVYLNGDEAHRLIYSVNGVQQVFNRFAEKVHDIRIRELGNVVPTMSCGVVYCNDSIDISFELLYDNADRALRLSKARRNGAITINEINYNQFY